VILGVPFRTGSLYPGNENDAQAYREANLVGRLTAAGCKAIDAGDLPIPSYLPHHSVPPIRSWPGPRIVWDIVTEKAAYFPHTEGLSLNEGTELLGVFLRDARVRVIEVSEYATLRDHEGESLHKIIDMLVQTLPKSAR
jgi:arginase family enzyme